MRMIDADVITDWLLQEIRARDGAFCGLSGRQAANMIGKRIDETPTVGGWVSVKDRLPDKDVDVLWCAWYDGLYGKGWDIRIDKWVGTINHSRPDTETYGEACNPLYWMPIPSTEGLDET